MGRFDRKTTDRLPASNGTPPTLVIQNGQVDDQTRAQLTQLGFDPDQFVDQMEAIGKAAKAGAAPADTAPIEPPSADLPTALAKLKGLHDSGALTDEEFTAAKAKLLS